MGLLDDLKKQADDLKAKAYGYLSPKSNPEGGEAALGFADNFGTTDLPLAKAFGR